MPLIPYDLPAGYQVLTGNPATPVEAADGTYWGMNIKKDTDQLHYAVFKQLIGVKAEEVLRFTGAGMGKLTLQNHDQALWASAYRTPNDAVSSPHVAQILGYAPLPAPAAAAIDQPARDQANAATRIAKLALTKAEAATEKAETALSRAIKAGRALLGMPEV